MTTVTFDAGQLAAALFAEAQRHPPRSAERRAAVHAWVSLVTTTSPGAALKAARTFGGQPAQDAALALLGRLATQMQEGTTR